MKRFALLIVALSNSAIAFSAPCANFSGSWSGSCSGVQAGIGGDEAFTFEQSACASIKSVNEEVTFLLDGQVHTLSEDFSYQALWLPNAQSVRDQLSLLLTANTAGVVLNVQYTFFQMQEGGSVASRTSTRSVPGLGGEELLETCSFVKQP